MTTVSKQLFRAEKFDDSRKPIPRTQRSSDITRPHDHDINASGLFAGFTTTNSAEFHPERNRSHDRHGWIGGISPGGGEGFITLHEAPELAYPKGGGGKHQSSSTARVPSRPRALPTKSSLIRRRPISQRDIGTT